MPELTPGMLELFKKNPNETDEQVARLICDVPNARAPHAFVKGLSIEKSYGPSIGDFEPLFQTAYEKVNVWTHEEDENSALISEVDLAVKAIPFWKTAGSLINLALAFLDGFEGIDTEDISEYKWIFDFSPATALSDHAVYNSNRNDCGLRYLRNSRILKATEISGVAPEIELLDRDNKCYTALMLLYSSYQMHYCHLACELHGVSSKVHPSDEPELWQHADYTAKMEGAVVQACRCVESILGEPPNQMNPHQETKKKQRWIELIGIDPDGLFEIAGLSYWQFYRKLFSREIRNPSAHSFGEMNIALKRKTTIELQCFAAFILGGYMSTNKKPFEEALEILHFNIELLRRVSVNTTNEENKQQGDMPLCAPTSTSK